MFNKVWGVLRGTAEQRLHNDMGRFRTGEEGGLFVHYSEFDGVLGYNAGYLKPPAEMINFILEQFARWETGLPPELAGIAEIGCHYALSYIDQYDPYFFVAYSDICETPDCSTHIYKIKPLGHFSHEFSREHIAPFEKIESFVHSPEKATSYFNEFMSQRPSLKLFMFSDTSYIEMEIEGSNNEYSAVAYAKDNFPSEFIEAMVSFFPKKEDYFAAVEFATAAGLIWLAGPLGTYFRHTTVEVCNTVQEHGECLVYDYMILSPDAYEKIALPIKTCGCCGFKLFLCRDRAICWCCNYSCV